VIIRFRSATKVSYLPLVPGLLPQSEAEQLAFEMGALNKKRRLAESELSLAKAPPSSDERLLIHQLYLAEQQLKRQEIDNSRIVYMHQTKLQNVMYMYPQSRNVFGKVFGGWLMREAYELAWLTASLFARSTPTFVCIDDIHFIEPVEIGAVLELNSVVAFVGMDILFSSLLLSFSLKWYSYRRR
jgi:acyl-coenzyme A thioesterase 9